MGSAAMDTSGIFRVDGMVAVITGGGTGIGLMMSKALAQAGAPKVYILGRRMEVLTTAAKSHPSLVPLQCDVTSKASLQAAVDHIAQDSGFVNLLIANSGVVGPAKRFNPSLSIAELKQSLFDSASMDDFTQSLHVNVTGAYFTMLAFLELLDAGNKHAMASEGAFGAPTEKGKHYPSVQSQVIFTSSISAYSRAQPSAPAYSGGKAAIAHLAKHASTQLGGYGIRVNALAPGLFPSVLATDMIGNRNPDTETAASPGFIPAGKFGSDEEMGGSVLYLASRAGSFCNGLILVMDGGRLSMMQSEY